MSFNLIIIKQPPYQGRSSHEVLEAVMSLGLFEIDHKIVFFEQAIGWLLEGQSPKVQKSLEKQLNALPMYGCEALYFVEEHANQLFAQQTLNDNAEALPLHSLITWINQAKHVEVF